MSSRWRELVEELRTVLAGRGNLADALIPPLLFAAVNALLGVWWAMGSALLLSLMIALFRWRKGQSLKYALGGLGATILAVLSVRLFDSAQAYFLPGILTSALTAIACAASVAAGRPLVALTSHIVRRWPLEWYWHPKVRPAYSEVTAAWGVFFVLKLAIQLITLRRASAGALAVIQAIMGWPATIVLLVLSYLYGVWRLQQLEGPSVDEFESGAEPPWTGQRRGF